MVETINGIERFNNAVHMEPKRVLELAKKPTVIKSVDGVNIIEGELSDKRGISLIHDFDENYNDVDVNARVKALTGFSAEEIYQKTKIDLKDHRQRLSSHKLSVLRGEGGKKDPDFMVMKEGDKYLLDPIIVKEKKQRIDDEGNVELLSINLKFGIGDKNGESVIVNMYKYGAPKVLILPEGNPNNQVEYEMFYYLDIDSNKKNKKKITVVVANNLEDHAGLSVAEDDGTKFDLKPGDALFIPLNTPRQVISNDGEFGNLTTAVSYYTQGEAWFDGMTKPFYWPEQVK